MQHISESVFLGLCEVVGTSQQVAPRRETMDIKEMVRRQLTPYYRSIQIVSGNKKEEFRLRDQMWTLCTGHPTTE